MINFFAVRLFCYKDILNCCDHDDQLPPRKEHLKVSDFEDLKAIAKSKERHILSLVEKNEIRTADFSTDGFIRRYFETITRGENVKQHAMVRLSKYLAERKTRKLSLNLNLIAIALVKKDGKVVSSADERLIGRDFSGDEVFLEGMRKNYGETYIDQMHYSSGFDTNCTFVSAPIIARHGRKTLGVTVNAYSVSALNEITTNRIGMGATGEVYHEISRFARNDSHRKIASG